MVQTSGPLIGSNFTDDGWRTAVGRQGITLDYTGTAYALTLPTSSNDVIIGPGKSVVAGFGHEIPTGETHTVEVPDSSNASIGRTDIIGVAYDPAYTEDPGPCRLIRVAGTEGSAARPSVDMQPPGVEVMPLYAITRRQGESLTQAAVVDLRRWVGPSLVAPSSADPIGSVPMGTTLLRGDVLWARRLDGPFGTSQWFSTDLVSGPIDQSRIGPSVSEASFLASSAGWSTNTAGPQTVGLRNGPHRQIQIYSRKGSGHIAIPSNGNISDVTIATLAAAWRPRLDMAVDFLYHHDGVGTFGGTATINRAGEVTLRSGTPNTVLSAFTQQSGNYSVFIGTGSYLAD